MTAMSLQRRGSAVAFARGHQLPDGVGDGLDLAPRVGAGEEADAAVAHPVGARRALAGGGAPQHIALDGGEQRRAGRLVGLGEAAVEVALGQVVEQPHVLAAGPSPVAQRQVLGVLEEAVGIFFGRRQRPGILLLAPPQLARRLDVIPQLAAGIQGEEPELACLGEPVEELLEGAGDVGDAEDVQRGQWPAVVLARQLQRAVDELRQRHPPPALLAVRRRMPLQPAAAAGDGEPERPLPGLERFEVSLAQRRTRGPRRQHLRPRVGVLLEEPRQPAGELHPPQRHAVGVGRLEVVADRLQRRRREHALVVEQRQEAAAQRLGVDEPAAGRRLAHQLADEALQPPEAQVGGDAQPLGEPEPHHLLEVAVGHHQLDRLERMGTGAAPRAHRLGQSPEQLLGAVGIDQPDHREQWSDGSSRLVASRNNYEAEPEARAHVAS